MQQESTGGFKAESDISYLVCKKSIDCRWGGARTKAEIPLKRHSSPGEREM